MVRVRTLLVTALLAGSALAAAQSARWACDVQYPPAAACMVEGIVWSADSLNVEVLTGGRVGTTNDDGAFRVDPYVGVAYYQDDFWTVLEARYPFDFLPAGVRVGGPTLRLSFGSRVDVGGLFGGSPESP